MLGHPLLHLVAAFLILGLVQSLAVKVYQVPSASMKPTLTVGDRLLVNRLAYQGSGPAVGDVVVFDRPATWSDGARSEASPLRIAAGWVGDFFGFGPSNHDALVKRVVAGPGDSVQCCSVEGRLIRNGAPVDEPFLGDDLAFVPGELDCTTRPRSQRCFPILTLPEDRYLVLGDNRAHSGDGITPCRASEADSSAGCARLVAAGDIVGKVTFVFLPFDRWGSPLLDGPPR